MTERQAAYIARYEKAKVAYDTKGMADVLCDWRDNFQVDEIADMPDEYYDRYKIIQYQVFKELLAHNGARARYYIDHLPKGKAAIKHLGHPYYYGLSYYEDGDYQTAAAYFREHLDHPLWLHNELGIFFLANTLAYLGDYDEAEEFYQKAIGYKKSFSEAVENLAAAKQGKPPQHRYPWGSYLAMKGKSIFDIPIFINSRDRVECLKRLVAWLTQSGYRRIYILDQNSTYQPLLDYYAEIDGKLATVIRFSRNIGHMAVFKSDILEILEIDTPYIYTDSDVVPEDTTPVDLIEVFYQILVSCPFFRKVSLGIKYSDITFYNKKEAMKVEAQKENTPILPNVYIGAYDTTFALYGNHRFYSVEEAAIVRIEGAEGLHLPWYYGEVLPPDEEYYVDHADRVVSTFSRGYFADLANKQ